MRAANPIDTDFCGLSGVDATAKLITQLTNLANGTAIEDCSVISRMLKPNVYQLESFTQEILQSESVLSSWTLPTVDYPTCLNISGMVGLTYDEPVPVQTAVVVELKNGTDCTGTVLSRVRHEKAQPTGNIEVIEGLSMEHYICFPANAPREFVICADRSNTDIGSTLNLLIRNMKAVEYCN